MLFRSRVGADGINIDFEYITKESGPHYIQFLRELYIESRKANLLLSVDNYLPNSGNTQYEMAKQAKIVDYVVIMAYDEHHSNSEQAGPVASLPFVEQGIVSTLKKVPKEQIVMGIPFYVRKWKTEYIDGVATVTSEAGGMSSMWNDAQTNGATVAWNDEQGQYYAEYQSDGALYQYWLEEETIMKARLDLMKQYNLAGYAAWKLGLESNEIWNVIPSYLE